MVGISARNYSLFLLLSLGTLIGCGGPGRIAPPEWAPEEMADSAMSLNDLDGDGEIGKEELEKAPGLKAAVERDGENSADTDGNGSLSRDEIRDRIKLFQDSELGVQLFAVTIRLNKKPLGGATITLEPEEFLSGTLKTATCVTREDGTGRPESPIADIMGVQPGMYRVKITHPDKEIPAKYNEETTLGIDLAPTVSGYGSDDRFTFNIKSR